MRDLALIVALLLTSCAKDKTAQGQAWDGKNHITGDCNYAPVTESGAIVPGVCRTTAPCSDHFQDVATVTNVIDHPLDSIAVSLCNGSGCVTMPSVHIIVGRGVVSFLNAFESGYTTYNINEAVCQSAER